jgi:tRNA uridine 5-carboxymethylaminomethyl modification enzyme
MLTARAEYRLRLRANNATTRLTPLALAAGCVGVERRDWFTRREDERALWDAALDQPASAGELRALGINTKPDAGRLPLRDWLRFPDITLADLSPLLPAALDPSSDLADELAEDAAYAPYLSRQDSELRTLRASEAVKLGAAFPYATVPGLSNEMVERLGSAQPEDLAAAGRVRGITPAALAALLVHARRLSAKEAA